MKNTVFGIIWDNRFTSEVKLKLYLIFKNFQNGRYFEVTANFFLPEVIPVVEYVSKIWMSIPNIFELLIEAAAEILMEI